MPKLQSGDEVLVRVKACASAEATFMESTAPPDADPPSGDGA